MFRIAHVSDPHILTRTAAHWRGMLFNKRLTGYANLVLQRGRVHRRDYLLSVLAAAAGQSDHVVVTGDITNLSLEHEYEEARALLAEVARRAEVTVVPGNHDIYLHSIQEHRRFVHHFRTFMDSDLPELAHDLPAGPFPFVQVRGPVAFIGVSSAIPRPPFVSAGRIGRRQIEAVERVLAHPAMRGRTPILLLHHPPVDQRLRIARLRDGLVDAAALRAVLARVPRAVVLFGHLHVRRRWTMRTASGAVDLIAASGAALDHQDPSVRAGFNLYEVDDDGTFGSVEAHVVDPVQGGFETRSVERVIAHEERR